MNLESVAAHPVVRLARRIVHETDDETMRDLIEIVQIAAPTFGETARGEHIAERFHTLGLATVERDAVGNVLARLPGSRAETGEPVVLAAHLDTVFPDGTDLSVRPEGDRIYAPGIADNARGLAALLAVARALVRAEARPVRPIVFVATVGEEGSGDLRGVKHLFREASRWRQAKAFITLDGTGCNRIVHRGVGSRRLRAVVTGPGGHSWADWGAANPIHASGTAVAGLARLTPPRQPRTSLTVGRIGGGTSINSIPADAWFELDLRSESSAVLEELESHARDIIVGAVKETNRRRREGSSPVELAIRVIGDRPGGETPPGTALVRAARTATRMIGDAPELIGSSTDANVPMSIGIPSIAIGAGGISGGSHTKDEWYANQRGSEGIERALLTVVGVAGVG